MAVPTDYSGGVGAPSSAIMVSPTIGQWALKHGAIVAGTPGFGGGPIYTFDGGSGIGWITYSFGASGGSAGGDNNQVAAANPTETSYALYGHIIPLTVFGIGRIGGDIIAGPWVANDAASFCISFGV